MKKAVFATMILLLALTARATGQQADILVVDGNQWALLCRPICYDSLIYNRIKSLLPKDHTWKSTNWDGFQSAWSIKDDMLVLDSVLVDVYDGEQNKDRVLTIPRQGLAEAFPDSQCPFVAKWLTDTIRAARGNCIRYEDTGFDRNYEHEILLAVKRGHVVSLEHFENKVLVNGFDLRDSVFQELITIPSERYPDIASGRNIIFRIGNLQVDRRGNLKDCLVVAYGGGLHHDDIRLNQLADDFKAGLKRISPWRVMLINGKLAVCDGNDWYAVMYKLK